MRIPGADLSGQVAPLRAELLAAFGRLLDTAQFIQGPDVASFEAEFAAYCGVRHVVGVANGTDALVLALRAVEVGPDDLVVVPAFTFAATAEAVCLIGARPVFVDIDPATFNLCPQALAAAAREHGEKLQAVLPVHLYGRPAPMREIAEIACSVGASVVEDAAQAHGARQGGSRAGALGRAACFSFYPTKNLGAGGDGGAVTTDDDEVAARVRLLRDHGQSAKYEHAVVGTNSRLDTLQAVILRAKLPLLDGWNERRRAIAARYADGLAGVPGVTTPAAGAGDELVHHLYVIRCDRRDALQRHLAAAEIATSVHYPRPLHQQPAFAPWGEGRSFPAAEAAAREVLALPCYPELADAAVDHVCATIRSWAADHASA